MARHIHLQETLCDDLANAMLLHPRYARYGYPPKPDAHPDCHWSASKCFDQTESLKLNHLECRHE